MIHEARHTRNLKAKIYSIRKISLVAQISHCKPVYVITCKSCILENQFKLWVKVIVYFITVFTQTLVASAHYTCKIDILILHNLKNLKP